MQTQDTALDLFQRQFSCTQSVLAAFGQRLGLDHATALKLGRAMGLGLGQGQTCGAVTGALMVLGLAAGEVEGNDFTTRVACYAKGRALMAAFRDLHGSTDCRDLLGLDPSTREGMARARELNLIPTRCPAFVKTACELVEESL